MNLHNNDKNNSPENEKPSNLPKVVSGTLFAWFETGLEGLVWAVQKNEVPGYQGIHVLKAGDYLTVKDHAGDVLFDGYIEPDNTIGKRMRYHDTGYEQPVALGCWIHWTQKGWQPDAWASLFVHENNSGVVVVNPS